MHEIAALENSCVDVSVKILNWIPRIQVSCELRPPSDVKSWGLAPEPRGRQNLQGLYPSLSTVGCMGAQLPVAESHCGRTRCRIPSDLRIHLALPLRKCKLQTTTPVAHALDTLEGK